MPGIDAVGRETRVGALTNTLRAWCVPRVRNLIAGVPSRRSPCDKRSVTLRRCGAIRRRAGRRMHEESSAYPGQTLIIFALASFVLLGAMGLVLDIGYDLGQRRTMQNAADAAVLRGAQDVLSNAKVGPVTTLWDEVKTIAMANGLGDPANASSGATLTCRFLDNGGADLGACDAAIPVDATGVVVTAYQRHPTFVMNVLGIGTSGAGATSTAYVEALAPDAFTVDQGPFIVCGYQTQLTGSNAGTMSILVTNGAGKAGNPPQINRNAVGRQFDIHGSAVATCGTQGNRFKGVNDQNANAGVQIAPGGTVVKYKPGVNAGPSRGAVAGVNGCAAGQSSGCVMLLPVADATNVDSGSCQCINVVMWAAFWVDEPSANSHTGILLDYVVQARGTRTWSSTSSESVAVIRLTR